MQLICGRVPNCGFRAHDRYFSEKLRFMAGVCPRCNGPVTVVEDYTDTRVPHASIETNPNHQDYRTVVVREA